MENKVSLQACGNCKNQFEKMSSVTTHIKALTELLKQNNEESDNVIVVNSVQSDDDNC